RETGALKGLAHITGGGFTDNIPRVLPRGLGARIDLGQVPLRPVFGWLAETGNIAQDEMLHTFNCGIGMVAIVAAADRDRMMQAFADAGERVVALGEVTRAGDARVTYSGQLGRRA